GSAFFTSGLPFFATGTAGAAGLPFPWYRPFSDGAGADDAAWALAALAFSRSLAFFFMARVMARTRASLRIDVKPAIPSARARSASSFFEAFWSCSGGIRRQLRPASAAPGPRGTVSGLRAGRTGRPGRSGRRSGSAQGGRARNSLELRAVHG